MKPALLLLAFLALPLAASAETIDLGPRGTFTVTPPKGWTSSVTKNEDAGFTILLTPPPEVNARCVVNLVLVPKDEPLSKDDLKDKVLSIADRFVAESVEKKPVLHDFALTNGSGCYCLFTDASRVDKAPEKDNFKVLVVGMIRYNDALAAAVSLLTDDAGSPEYAAMMKAVTTAAVSAK
jgi:hypothetical protein